MKVSIIIPVYNVSEYIERCMDSVMDQTYPDIECILVDDCSPDNSVELIEKKLVAYSGSITFIILHHEKNKGLSGARNTGIEASTGDYLYFLDSDDEITENSIELLAGMAFKHTGVDIVQGSSDVFEGSSLNKMYHIRKSIPDFSDSHFWLKKSMLESENYPLTAWNKLIKRDFLLNGHLLYKEGIIHEDEHWNFFAAKEVKSMAFCRIPTYRHFIREGSIMTSTDRKKSISSWFFIIQEYITHIDPDMARFQRKMILKAGFGNLAHITWEASKFPVDNLLKRQRELMKPCLISAWKRCQIFELLLLSYFYQPVFVLKFLCMKNVRGIYFRIVKYLV